MTAPTPIVGSTTSCATDRSCPPEAGCCASAAPTQPESSESDAPSTAPAKGSKVAARAGFGAAACVACCAPPIIATLGLTAGIAATAGLFIGLAAAIAVVLAGVTWLAARVRRHRGRSNQTTSTTAAVDSPSVAASAGPTHPGR